VKPGVKARLGTAACRQHGEVMQMLAFWAGLANGMMTAKRGLHRFLFNLLNFLTDESSRHDYTLLQQII